VEVGGLMWAVMIGAGGGTGRGGSNGWSVVAEAVAVHLLPGGRRLVEDHLVQAGGAARNRYTGDCASHNGNYR
jgi:hypothetical protein